MRSIPRRTVGTLLHASSSSFSPVACLRPSRPSTSTTTTARVPEQGTDPDPYCRIQDAICDLKGSRRRHGLVRPGHYNESLRMFAGISVISTDGPAVTTIDATGQPCIRSRLPAQHDESDLLGGGLRLRRRPTRTGWRASASPAAPDCSGISAGNDHRGRRRRRLRLQQLAHDHEQRDRGQRAVQQRHRRTSGAAGSTVRRPVTPTPTTPGDHVQPDRGEHRQPAAGLRQ